MATKPPRPAYTTVEELLDSLGGVPAGRVRFDPVPGTATEKDVIRLYQDHKRLYELIDGTLVEKAMGSKESFIAGILIQALRNLNDQLGNLGMVLGEAGTIRLMKSLVRIPDVSFTRWEKLPSRKVPAEAIPELTPDLAVEVLSKTNTRAEMARKLKEYFMSGVRLVWFINPRARTARSFTSPDDVTEIGPDGALDGGDVLPGFRLPIAQLFADVEDEPAARAAKRAPRKKR